MPDPIEIQFQHFVVECGQKILVQSRELPRNLERFGLRLRLSKNKFAEGVSAERARPVEDYPIEITLQREAIRFDQVRDFFVTIAEVFPIEIELLSSRATRVMAPTVREQDAADVEENGRNHIDGTAFSLLFIC